MFVNEEGTFNLQMVFFGKDVKSIKGNILRGAIVFSHNQICSARLLCNFKSQSRKNAY